ncbi:MAG: DNA polymerase III subunit gamma/tau [Spiroplasma sp.]
MNNYKALYRKYRPTSFSQIVGQNDVVTILKNSIINKSFTHAYLFSGTKGTGKTSVAKILAKAINCENNVAGEACNQCSICKIINTGNDEIDILEIDGASNNGVEEIRNIRNNVNLLPMNLKYKVYIIDEVHMLTTAAFNALLKTLEEPPKHIIFIFATTEPYKIPETVISRCQWFQFEKINQANLVKVFSQILTAEKITFEPEALKELTLLCDGSLRDGINNLEKVFNFSNEVTIKNVNKIYNHISGDKKVAFLKAILNQNFNEIMLVFNDINNYLSDLKKFLIEMMSLIQDILIYRLTKNIKISKYLKTAEINIFSAVSSSDLKAVLNSFEEIIVLNFNSDNLKTLLIARILKLFDNFKQYDFSDKLNSLNVVKQKEVVAIENNIENVSEETKNDQISANVISEEMINNVLNVIVQADKDIRKEVKGHWLKIHQLIENNKFRNFSKIYLNTKITAACANGLIIICDNIIQANLINKNFNYQEHRNFLNFVFTKEFMIYALDRKQWKVVGQKYQCLIKDNQLPTAKPILIPEVVVREIVEPKSQTLTFLQNIFSEIEEI